MIRQILFAASSMLAVAGGTLAVCGIFEVSFKFIAVGVVLISTAGVFATLYLGSRATQ